MISEGTQQCIIVLPLSQNISIYWLLLIMFRACLGGLRLHQTNSGAATPPICSSTVELNSPFGAEEMCLAETTTAAPKNDSLNGWPSFALAFFPVRRVLCAVRVMCLARNVCVLCLCLACGVCAVCACAWRVACVHVCACAWRVSMCMACVHVCACAWRVWLSACVLVCLCGVRDFFLFNFNY
jgi:hypothetical protein